MDVLRAALARVRSYWHGLRQPANVDAEMADEMRFHIEMEAERLIASRGLPPDEARRQAAVAFGGVEKYRGAGRDALGFSWARGLSTDMKLGVRMLRKYPGLTAVALFALSLAIGAGAAYLEFVTDLLHGRLPFHEGGRIVGVQNWDQQSGDPEDRSTFDFVAWRGALATIDDLGAYRPLDRTLITGDGRAEPVRGVEISAAAFRMARVAPLLGRPLVPDDERAGAAPVVVLGHDLWESRFASDPSVIGRTVRVGSAVHTVVGVMPGGFGFPVAHSLWVPLRLNDATYPRRQGDRIKMFGRLASGADLHAAQAELTAVAARIASDYPDTHRYLRPVVKPYVDSLWSTAQDSVIQRLIIYAGNLFFLGLLALCGANIATLVFARTATRETEISVRTALGASRGRIAGQLFAEALVMSAIAAIAGLTVAWYGLHWVKHTITVAQGARLMFWWNDQLSPSTLIYAGVLAIGASIIIGVIPAMKATGINVQERLKHATGASSRGLRFGGVWTVVIVAQVGVTVIFLAIAGTLGWGLYFGNAGDRPPAFPADQYLGLRLTFDHDAPALFRARFDQFAQRVGAEPGVTAITYGAHLPGMNLGEMILEVEGVPELPSSNDPPYVRTTDTAINYLQTFQAPMAAGRAFTQSDLAPNRHVAIVDRTFVRHVLAGQEAIGRRIRSAARGDAPAGPWLEIVGVVNDLDAATGKDFGDAVVYRPAPVEAAMSTRVGIHAKGDPTALIWRLRVIAAEIDPSLRLDDFKTVDRIGATDRIALDFFLRILAGIGAVALILALAGVYALMSFTVARRTPEIGIRLALGANPRRIVLSTFGRALLQVGAGVVLGGIPAGFLAAGLAPEVAAGADATTAIYVCAGAAAFMAIVTALACFAPARRALRIQPVDTLKTT
jgi:predicted permease